MDLDVPLCQVVCQHRECRADHEIPCVHRDRPAPARPDVQSDRHHLTVTKQTRVDRWRRGLVVSGVRRMNEVNARRARLVPGWVTIFGRVYHLGM